MFSDPPRRVALSPCKRALCLPSCDMSFPVGKSADVRGKAFPRCCTDSTGTNDIEAPRALYI